MHYKSETQSGSSGSPVFNDQGELIGLHYSDCFAIDKALFKHVEALCTQLGFTLNQENTDSTAYCFTKNNESLYVYRDGAYEWQCSTNRAGTKKFNLSTLILKHDKQIQKKKSSLISFILKFLKDQGDFHSEEHLYCNTAIPIDMIIEDLDNDPAKKQKLEQALQDSQMREPDFRPVMTVAEMVITIGLIGLGLFLLLGKINGKEFFPRR